MRQKLTQARQHTLTTPTMKTAKKKSASRTKKPQLRNALAINIAVEQAIAALREIQHVYAPSLARVAAPYEQEVAHANERAVFAVQCVDELVWLTTAGEP